MEDDFEEMENLMDDDPALDYILYEDMEQKGGAKGRWLLGSSGNFAPTISSWFFCEMFNLFWLKKTPEQLRVCSCCENCSADVLHIVNKGNFRIL